VATSAADLSHHDSGSAPAGTSVYRRALAVRGVRSFFVATVPARLGGAMTGLGLLWLVHGSGGSYGRAGLVIGAFTLASALSGPAAARVIDRHGPTRTVPLLAGVHVLALTGVVLLVSLTPDGGPTGVVLAAAALAGAADLRVGALAAARWARLLPTGPLLTAAYALEAFSTDAAYVAGPALAGLLAALLPPVAAIIVAATLTVGGAVAVTAQRRTAPPPARPRPADPAAARRRTAAGRLLTGRFAALMAVNLALGTLFGATGVSVTAFAQEHHAATSAGLVYGVLGAASMASGLVYGRRHRRLPAHRQLPLALLALAVGYLPVLVADRAWTLAAALVLPGAALGPTVVLSCVLTQAAAPPTRLTQAFSTLASVNALGLAGAAAAAGQVDDRWGAAAGFAIAQVALTTVALAVAAARGRPDGPTGA